MRLIAVGFLIVTFATGSALAQQQPPKQSKVVKTNAQGGKCTHEACVARGVKMGNPPSDASIWCSRNNNGC